MHKTLVGMLLLGALIVFALATFYVENWQLALGEGYTVTARFPTVNTLDPGDPVRLLGKKVGSVREVDIDPGEGHHEKPVVVTFWLAQGTEVRAQDEVTIRTDSLFGGNFVSITYGDRSAPLIAQDGTGVIDEQYTAVEPGLGQVVAQSQETLRSIQGAFNNFAKLSADDGVLGKLAQDTELYDQVKSIVDSAEQSAQRMREGKGVLGKLFNDEELAAKLDSVASEMETLTKGLNAGEGTAGKLLSDDTLYKDIEATVAEIRETASSVRKGEGILPKLLGDEQMAKNAEELLANARAVSEDLRAGKGSLGKLLSEEGAYDELSATLADIRGVAGDLREGKGTLGMLIKDDAVYRQAKGILADMQAIIGAMREQSPVITFTGTVLGAF